MKIIPFDKRNHGACPGCGMFDNGTHYGHRYTPKDCMHSYHASWDCPDGNYQRYRQRLIAKAHKAIQAELI